MAYTTINKGTDYFNTKLYTGDGNATNAITGVGFQPDWVWIKNRGTTARHVLFDAVRGSQKALFSHLADAEQSTNQYGTLNSFDSDGFTVADGSSNGERTNNSSENYVSWNWKANGAGSANTDGSITSTVSANTTAGFSILTRTGTGSNGTVGHGLGVAPKMIINKDRNSGSSWWGVYHESLGNTNAIYLNTTNATDASSAYWNNTSPTSSVFSVGTNSISNASGGSYISYCFAEKTGYSKFGSYTGNGNANGAFIYTGFKPALVIVKRSSAVEDWKMFDNKRPGYNLTNLRLKPNGSESEASSGGFDFTSNGFKARSTDAAENASGSTYIYMAFAERPFVGTNNIPATAR
jgi:hypothetical protein